MENLIRKVKVAWLKKDPELQELYFNDPDTEEFIDSFATWMVLQCQSPDDIHQLCQL